MWLLKSLSLAFAFQFKSNVLIAWLHNTVTQKENPPQNRICIFLSCFELDHEHDHDDRFVPSSPEQLTSLKQILRVSVTVNQKEEIFVNTKTVAKLIFKDPF